jgi:retinol dehydrogenase-12
MGFIKSQFTRLPYPTQPFDGQTLIITGANVGLGLEAARHITRLGAARVILACRSFQKGQEAQKSIEQSTGRLGVCEVWPLDMEDFDSVKEFAERAAKLDRLDVLLANAGIALLGDELSWSKKADMETTVAVNVVGTFLLALLVLPILRKTGQKYGIIPRLTITSSEVHGWVSDTCNCDICQA